MLAFGTISNLLTIIWVYFLCEIIVINVLYITCMYFFIKAMRTPPGLGMRDKVYLECDFCAVVLFLGLQTLFLVG